MNTVVLNGSEKTKKLIELPNDICRRLAVQAAMMGTSVKRLIETMVIEATEKTDDETIYSYLLETRPEGSVMISETEQDALLGRLREKAGRR